MDEPERADEEREARIRERAAMFRSRHDKPDDPIPLQDDEFLLRELDSYRVALSGARADLEMYSRQIDDQAEALGQEKFEVGRLTKQEFLKAEIERLRTANRHERELVGKLHSQIDRLTEQLPEGMKHCTILVKGCEKGHGRLTATNWIDHGCQYCEIERLRAEIARLRAIYAEVAGRDPFEATERELAKKDAASTEVWKPGDPRCDFCDNGILPSWAFCPYCNRVLNADIAAERAPDADAMETARRIVEEYEPETCGACGGPFPNMECGNLKNAQDAEQPIPCYPVLVTLEEAIAREIKAAERQGLDRAEQIAAEVADERYLEPGAYSAANTIRHRIRAVLKDPT